MTTFTVTTDVDVVDASDGVLSLREAVAQANATTAADTIVFHSTIEGRTLRLTGGELPVGSDVVIDGDKNDDGSRVTLSGGDSSRLVRVDAFGSDVALRDLTLTDGNARAGSGGAILLDSGSLTVTNCTVSDSGMSSDEVGEFAGGGGIYAASGTKLAVIGSSIVGNYIARPDTVARLGGGAIATGTSTEVLIRDSLLADNTSNGRVGGAVAMQGYGRLTVEDSVITGNTTIDASGAGIWATRGNEISIARTLISDNSGIAGGGLFTFYSDVSITDSTFVGNVTEHPFSGSGAGIFGRGGKLTIRNTTITGNEANRFENYSYTAGGGGLFLDRGIALELDNSIIAGNLASGPGTIGPDIAGAISFSNGHNIFGSDVTGNVSGDLENVAAMTLFADIAGLVNADGIVPLRANVANPAISGADRLLAMSTDQLGNPRPVPSESSPDTGAVESGFAPSKVASAGNDVLTGTAAANVIKGFAGHDFIKGLAGNDTLSGNDGGDFLTGGLGNDKLNGGNGIDLVNYADLATAVTIDLRGDAATDTDIAKRGSETDTLTGIEGAVGSSKGDIFFGDSLGNWFQGGGGKDTYTGGAGRDLYDYNLTSAAGLGTSRDMIKDFAHLSDKIDLAGIDADSTAAGNQAFRWVGSAALTGAGEVGYYTADGNTIIRMSTDADAASEGEIQLTGIKTLMAVDFYL